MSREICFEESQVKLYIFLLILIILYLLFVHFKSKNQKITETMSNINFNSSYNLFLKKLNK